MALGEDATVRATVLSAIRMDELAQARGIDMGYQIANLVGQDTVKSQFVQDVLVAPDLSEDDRLRILLTGLRALDGNDDLTVD